MKKITDNEIFDGFPMFTIHTRVTMHMIRINQLRRMLIPAIVISIGASTGFAQSSSPAMSAEEIAAHVKYLSSDELEGRGSGTPGHEKAAAYVIRLLQSYGLHPAGDSGTYQQHFEFVAGVKLGSANEVSFAGAGIPGGRTELSVDSDFRPLGFSEDTSVAAPLVFAGYGISANDSSYDDFRNCDVTGKVVVVLRYSPAGSDPHASLNQVSSLRNKARLARERGALGLIVVTGPRDDQDDDLIRLTFDQAFASSGIPAISMKRSALDPLVHAAGWTFEAIQDTINRNKKPVTFVFPDVRISLRTDVRKVTGRTENVVAFLPGRDPVLKDEAVILGAHLDHLGYGGPGSGSMVPDTVAIHHGADDNASGSAGLLAIARSLAADSASLQRSVVVIFFSGEELGTLGSGFYVLHPFFPLSATTAMINMDMVGRMENNTLTVNGTGTSTVWDSLLTLENTNPSLTLKSVPDGYGPSDHAQFYGKDIPVLFFFTGTHNDYHKPSDTWDRLNYPGEEQVVRLVGRITGDLVRGGGRPPFVRVASTGGPSTGDARAFRVTLGIIPDYAEGTHGMKICGVRPGGAAEKAGLMPGDIIVMMGGKKVLNIYDYMGLLGELKAGQVVEVRVMRGGKSVTCTATMEKRK